MTALFTDTSIKRHIVFAIIIVCIVGSAVRGETTTVEFENFFTDIALFNQYTQSPGPVIAGGSSSGVDSSWGLQLGGRHALTYLTPSAFPNGKDITVSTFFKTGDLSLPVQGSLELLGEVYLTSVSSGHPFQFGGSNTFFAGVNRYDDGSYLGIGARLANGSIYPVLEQSLTMLSNRWYQLSATFSNNQGQSVDASFTVTDYGATGLTAQGINGSTVATIPSLSAVLTDTSWHGGFAADADDGVDVDRFRMTIPNENEIQLEIQPTFDVQLRPGNSFPLGNATAQTLEIDGGSGANFPKLDVLMDFPLDQIPVGAEITSARLLLDPINNGSSGLTIQAHGYAGDGQASLQDETVTTTLMGTKTSPFPSTSDIAIDLDLNYVQSHVGVATHLGVRLKSATAGPFITIAASEHATAASPKLLITYSTTNPGDFDSDGDVDGRDFLAWQRNRSVGSLADWQANCGVGILSEFSTSPASVAASPVPEPGGLVLAFAGLMASACRKLGQCS